MDSPNSESSTIRSGFGVGARLVSERWESPCMTPPAPEPALLGPESWIHRLQLGGRVAVTIIFVALTYFLTPTKEPHSGSDLPWLLLQLGLFALVVAIQVPAIINAKHPILRAAIALGVLLPVYLLVFARLYLS